ncbi:MAG TPA: helix-turn-helix transcriptional regulator, partial [Arenibacter sp.]|nr:helix-turn-helix transcriptional regulator [Arenibacter sp.]
VDLYARGAEPMEGLRNSKMQNTINVYTKISPYLDIKIEPFDSTKRRTKPHRHNKYLEIVYFTEGSGFHYMDEKTYKIEPPVFFIIKNDVVHHWEIDSVPDGFVLIIKEGFLDTTLDKHINVQLQQLRDYQFIEMGPDPNLEGLFQIAVDELKELKDMDPIRSVTIEGIVKALLSKILGHAKGGHKFNFADVVIKFNSLLEDRLINDVAYYSQLLNTTPQNLNVHCRREYNKTASAIIADHIVKEAQRLLRYTDLTVSEIGYKFDFKDVSHFVKYFKRHHGITPRQYRTLIIP